MCTDFVNWTNWKQYRVSHLLNYERGSFELNHGKKDAMTVQARYIVKAKWEFRRNVNISPEQAGWTEDHYQEPNVKESCEDGAD